MIDAGGCLSTIRTIIGLVDTDLNQQLCTHIILKFYLEIDNNHN